MLVSSFDEWSQLEEVIVGRAENANIPSLDTPFQCLHDMRGPNDHTYRVPKYPAHVLEQANEDLENLVSSLEKMGVVVRRPDSLDNGKTTANLNWKTEGVATYCPRDIALICGETIIETPMTFRSRQNEVNGYKSIFIDYFKHGAKWISAPKPLLLDEMYSLGSHQGERLNNHEPVFDAANVVRAGKDIFYLVSESGNDLGFQWLKSTLGNDFTIHPCKNIYSGMHIDTTISLLRPGLALINPSRVDKTNIPPILKQWKMIECPEMIDIGSSIDTPLSSTWMGMNLLMVNENLAIVEKRQAPLIKMLEKNKIDVLALSLRHARTMGGGFHCVTLDVRRKNGIESYFD